MNGVDGSERCETRARVIHKIDNSTKKRIFWKIFKFRIFKYIFRFLELNYF